MKQIITFSLASLLATPTFIYTKSDNSITEDDTIILESPILHMFDGTAVNADVIELIGLIRREINKILIGERLEDGSMSGRYIINGKPHSIKDLLFLEESVSLTVQELKPYLEVAKKDLRASVEPFIETIRSVKNQIVELIKESCKKRNLSTSILLRWSEAGDGEEVRIFNEEVISFVRYNEFCTDLLNFLGDLIRSCPKGMAQFKIRSDKCQKARSIVKGIIHTKYSTQPTANTLEIKFMRHVKDNHIDKLSMTEITKDRIEALFTKFINQKH